MENVTEQKTTVFITGATDGLGRAVALRLAPQKNIDLILHGRDQKKGDDLLAALAESGNRAARFYRADFSRLREIRELSEAGLTREDKLHVLINNAGIGMEKTRTNSADGIELVFQVNYLATFLLSRSLVPLLERSAPSRIVQVSSLGQMPLDFADPLLVHNWTASQAYCQSKLAQIMCAIDLADELKGKRVTVNAVHPASYMPTKMVVGHFPVQSTVDEGVQAVVNLVLNPALGGVTGKFFNGLKPEPPLEQAMDPAARKNLRKLSEQIIGRHV